MSAIVNKLRDSLPKTGRVLCFDQRAFDATGAAAPELLRVLAENTTLDTVESASFDAVVSIGYLSSLDRTQHNRTLASIKRGLAPGGVFIALEPNAASLSRRRTDRVRFPGLLNHRELATALTHAELEITELTTSAFPMRFDGLLADWCSRSEWAAAWFASHMWVSATAGDAHASRQNVEMVSQQDASSQSLRILLLLLMVAGALRLYAINQPSIDFLSWRETQTLMVARNFYRESMNILLPAVDWRTTTQVAERGIVGGTELQIVPWLTACLYYIFGIHHWVGRVIPIFFALMGLAYFHRLVHHFYGPRLATIATILFLVSPFHFFTGRVQMPESFVFAMSFATLFHYARWLHARRNEHFWSATIFCVLMLLGKPQMGIVAIPMLYLTLLRFGPKLFLQYRLYLFAALVGAPFILFLWYSYSVLIPKTGLSFAQPGLLRFGLLKTADYYHKMADSIWQLAVGPLVCIIALLGLLLPARKAAAWLAHVWFFSGVAFLLLMPGGNSANSYYQMFLAPPAIILGARILHLASKWPVTAAIAALLLVASVIQSSQIAAAMYKPIAVNEFNAGTFVNQHAAKDALVLVSHPSPAALYYADRVGWTCWFENYGQEIAFNKDLLNKVGGLGASILLVPDGVWLEDPFHVNFSKYRDLRDGLYDSYYSKREDNFAVFWLRHAPDLTPPPSGFIQFGSFESRKYLRGGWGPNQTVDNGQPFIAMGPNPAAALKIMLPTGARRIVLHLSAAIESQKLTIRADGIEPKVVEIPRPWGKGEVLLDLPEQYRAGGLITLRLEVARQNQLHVGILLFDLEVETSP